MLLTVTESLCIYYPNAPLPTVHYTYRYLRAQLDSTRFMNFRDSISNIVTSERKIRQKTIRKIISIKLNI